MNDFLTDTLLLITAFCATIMTQAGDETPKDDDPTEKTSEASWVDPFERGSLPKLNSAHPSNGLRYVPSASIAGVGEFSSDLPEYVTGAKVEFLRETGRERIFGFEASIVQNRQYYFIAFPPQGGWPHGRMIVRFATRELPIISKECVIQIIDPNEPEGTVADTEIEARTVVPKTARVNLTIDPDRVRRFPMGMPVCICGRLKKTDEFAAKQLLLEIRDNGTLYCSDLVTLLEYRDELWFETWVNLNGRELRPGKVMAKLLLPGSGQPPKDLPPINIEIEPPQSTE